MLDAYCSGTLPHAFAVVVAAHLSLCDQCRAWQGAEDMIGGALLLGAEGADLLADARERGMMAALEAPPQKPPQRASGPFPSAVMHELGGRPPHWRMLGGGIRQQIPTADSQGSLRLLYIPPGKAVPEHGHHGQELTLVLQGSFSDSAGAFHRGDVEAAHDGIDHQPIAGPSEPCICLAATDAPLRFHALIPRLLQPVFRILTMGFAGGRIWIIGASAGIGAALARALARQGAQLTLAPRGGNAPKPPTWPEKSGGRV